MVDRLRHVDAMPWIKDLHCVPETCCARKRRPRLASVWALPTYTKSTSGLGIAAVPAFDLLVSAVHESVDEKTEFFSYASERCPAS